MAEQTNTPTTTTPPTEQVNTVNSMQDDQTAFGLDNDMQVEDLALVSDQDGGAINCPTDSDCSSAKGSCGTVNMLPY